MSPRSRRSGRPFAPSTSAMKRIWYVCCGTDLAHHSPSWWCPQRRALRPAKAISMIYTFYSFKGGVGRSMALANVAEWLYLQGLRVVMVDWDLEAPGLETFFFDAAAQTQRLQELGRRLQGSRSDEPAAALDQFLSESGLPRAENETERLRDAPGLKSRAQRIAEALAQLDRKELDGPEGVERLRAMVRDLGLADAEAVRRGMGLVDLLMTYKARSRTLLDTLTDNARRYPLLDMLTDALDQRGIDTLFDFQSKNAQSIGRDDRPRLAPLDNFPIANKDAYRWVSLTDRDISAWVEAYERAGHQAVLAVQPPQGEGHGAGNLQAFREAWDRAPPEPRLFISYSAANQTQAEAIRALSSQRGFVAFTFPQGEEPFTHLPEAVNSVAGASNRYGIHR